MPDRYQVVIIGGGPVGVALGVELGQRGITTAVVERHQEPVRIPKGQSLTNRTLEHFYFWNCLDRLRAARIMPPGYPIGGLGAYGSLASEYWRIAGDLGDRAGRGANGGHQPYYYQVNERLPQYQTEMVLRERLSELPSVTRMFGRTAKSFEQDGNGVRVTVEDSVWPYDEHVLEADYVVGCDGARSMVRESLGIDRHGSDFDQKMVLAIFSSPELHEALKRFPERTTYSVVAPGLKGARHFFGRVEVGVSWFFHSAVPRDANPENFDFEKFIQKAAGFEVPIRFEHIGFWELRIAVADTYRKSRAFIAGDAAHIHPPYGGFGLNSGLEDVTNLGWKLAAKLQGWGGETLLDSYSFERQPVFAQTGEDVIAAGIRRANDFAERYSPEKDKAEFEEAWERYGSGGGGPDQQYDPHYESSPVAVGSFDKTPGIHGGRLYTAKAGHHLVPYTLSTGRNVYEELGTGYTLFALSADEKSVSAIEQEAQTLQVPLKVVRDAYEGSVAGFGARLVLVRPDQHISWAADEAPSDAKALIKQVAGL